MSEFFKISDFLLEKAKAAEDRVQQNFKEIEEICRYNEEKVLSSFTENRVSAAHLNGSTGYGYDDMGRDMLDKVFAKALGAEDAIVRHNFVSGTHALTVALFGLLRTGDTLCAATGAPYDTLHDVIGLNGSGMGSLMDYGIKYMQLDLLKDGTPDYAAIKAAANKAKVFHIQRSCGYSTRNSFSVDTIGRVIKTIKDANPNAVVMVDNCYGEFVEKTEPTAVGADIIVGSLIKNAGGGIAPTGGYIAGKHELVEQCAYRLTTPGAGREVGCSLNANRELYMGIFRAPQTVCEALKTIIFATSLFDLLGYKTHPQYNAKRTDIIAAIELNSAKKLESFCRGIQKGSPVDSHVTPYPWDMPGYNDKVIMAAGAFTLGASIELSADGPLREPYAAYLQGGITYNTGRMGILLAAQQMLEEKED